MGKSKLPSMIGISGVTNVAVYNNIVSCVKPTATRPLCLTANLTLNTIERGVPLIDDVRYVRRTMLDDLFSRSIPNVINLVRCLRESPTEPYPNGETLARAMRIAGEHCNGIRLSFDDTTTDALIAFRRVMPDAIVLVDMTPTALRNRCEGNILTLCNLLSGYTEEYDDPLVDYVFVNIDERKTENGFPLKQGIYLLSVLLLQKIQNCKFGISGSINESVVGVLPEMFAKKWEEISVDGGESLREARTGILLADRVKTFLTHAYGVFNN